MQVSRRLYAFINGQALLTCAAAASGAGSFRGALNHSHTPQPSWGSKNAGAPDKRAPQEHEQCRKTANNCSSWT